MGVPGAEGQEDGVQGVVEHHCYTVIEGIGGLQLSTFYQTDAESITNLKKKQILKPTAEGVPSPILFWLGCHVFLHVTQSRPITTQRRGKGRKDVGRGGSCLLIMRDMLPSRITSQPYMP